MISRELRDFRTSILVERSWFPQVCAASAEDACFFSDAQSIGVLEVCAVPAVCAAS
jgi:hypothetical protein